MRSLHTGSNDHGVAGTIGLTGSAAGGVGLGGQAAAGSRAAGDWLGGGAGARLSRSPLPPFMVVGGRLHQGKKAIIGEGGGPLGALLRSVPSRIRSRRTARASRPCNCPPTSRPNGSPIASVCCSALDRVRDAGQTLGTGRVHRRLSRARRSRMLTVAGGAQDVRPVPRTARAGGSLWPDALRAIVPAGTPAGGAWRAVRAGELERPRRGGGGFGRRRLGPPLPQLPDHAGSARALAGPGACRPCSTDLHERGLLETTLVVAIGEFGRSPKINDKAGRDHWEHCYSALVAGGGVAGGRVVGESDRRGERPHDRPLTPADLAATIHHCRRHHQRAGGHAGHPR